ncbi:MAG: 2-oxoacid:ferredoxin oxidoreductase subunit beta [Gammaproteobacteria bacterium]
MNRKDFASSQEVRWCPGCGNYAVLATVQRFLATLDIPKENIVFVSGIGCAGRFPYYMNTYGFHTLHGRAFAVASGLKIARPELSVWVITGDGDGLSIGGNHFIHTLRRNIDINILLFNNRIYGLTKGQYSPTSELGKVTGTTPSGSLEQPINPISLALSAGATFVARSLDVDSQHLTDVLTEATAHKGTSFVEIYQNCNIFNDGAYEHLRGKTERKQRAVYLNNNLPLLYGEAQQQALSFDNRRFVTIAADDPENQPWIHDTTHWLAAHGLSQCEFPHSPVPMGVFYQQHRPTYEGQLMEQIHQRHFDDRRKAFDNLLQQGSWKVS